MVDASCWLFRLKHGNGDTGGCQKHQIEAGRLSCCKHLSVGSSACRKGNCAVLMHRHGTRMQACLDNCCQDATSRDESGGLPMRTKTQVDDSRRRRRRREASAGCWPTNIRPNILLGQPRHVWRCIIAPRRKRTIMGRASGFCTATAENCRRPRLGRPPSTSDAAGFSKTGPRPRRSSLSTPVRLTNTSASDGWAGGI